MNSFLKNFLIKNGENIIPYINKLNLKPNDITTLGILFNGLGLINLLNNEFVIFILLFISGYYCDILDGLYARKYNLETELGKKYDNIADWIKLSSTYLLFNCIHKNKITCYNKLFVVLILILCNLHFVLKYINKNLDKETKLSSFIKKYISGFKKLKINSLEKYTYITRFFDETMIIVYLILLMAYIHYK
jgi:archaetidylinositol phosphate synthase